MRKIVVILLLVTVIAACTNIDCPVNNRVYTVYNLKKADGTTDTLTKDTLWVITQRANGTDTVISRQNNGNVELNCFFGSTATTFELPISYTQPEDVLYMLVRRFGGSNNLFHSSRGRRSSISGLRSRRTEEVGLGQENHHAPRHGKAEVSAMTQVSSGFTK